MGLFDDLMSKVTELTNMGQDASDNVSQVVSDASTQIEDQASSLSENVPQDLTDTATQLSGDNNEQK